MKAWVLKDIGDISLQEREEPQAGAGEVRIRVQACGICGSDIPRIYETGAHRMPLVPGHEFAGVVEAVGEGVPDSWIGKRVAVCPKIPCGRCRNCINGHPDGCTSYDYSGSRRDGGFAEAVVVPADRLLLLPDPVSFEEGAMIEPLAVAANAVRTGCTGQKRAVASDAPIAVCGMGTIGLMTVMLLREAGYDNLYVIGNKESQKSAAGELGIEPEHFCSSRNEDPVAWLGERTGGVDCYFECVGSNASIGYGLEAGGYGSRLILVGNPRSDMTFPRDVYWKILRSQMQLVGIWNSSFRQELPEDEDMPEDDWHYVLKRLEERRIEPAGLISHRLSIEDLNRGFALMRDKSENYTKVMMVP